MDRMFVPLFRGSALLPVHMMYLNFMLTRSSFLALSNSTFSFLFSATTKKNDKSINHSHPPLPSPLHAHPSPPPCRLTFLVLPLQVVVVGGDGGQLLQSASHLPLQCLQLPLQRHLILSCQTQLRRDGGHCHNFHPMAVTLLVLIYSRDYRYIVVDLQLP